jgi:hypothetical protein
LGEVNKKNIVFSIIGLALCSLLFVACNEYSVIDGKIDPVITTDIKASNILAGQSIFDSQLTGSFDVEGNLYFINGEKVINSPGNVSCEWAFEPYDNVNYKKITGTVYVSVFEYKVQFEENGGFEIEDIFFDGNYTIEKKIITAKNEYRFDGWVLMDESPNIIRYPFDIENTLVLYAKYTFHTAEKLEYGIQYDNGQPTNRAFVTANWGRYGIAAYPGILGNNDPPIEGSISGEVVMADMYNGFRVTAVSNFSHTNITGIVFSNFIETIGSFVQCRKLGLELIIPNTVVSISAQAFENCHSLERIDFEAGDGCIQYGSRLFYQSGLKEVVLNRIDCIYEWTFAFTNIQSIVIPESITAIYQSAFAGSDLNEITIEGNNLEYVAGYAFNACSITNIAFPSKTRISPDAFKNALFLEEIDVTDEQINWIAQDLCEAFVGDKSDLTVNIIRDEAYSGLYFEGEYLANTETINLRFEKFSLQVLDALIHEFFHYYQYVLMYGVGDANYYNVPVCVDQYSYSSMTFPPPYIIIANVQLLLDEKYPELGYLYEFYVYYCENLATQSYILIDEDTLNLWKEEYIQLLPDNSNWDAYWNQTFETDARAFATIFTGIQWS